MDPLGQGKKYSCALVDLGFAAQPEVDYFVFDPVIAYFAGAYPSFHPLLGLQYYTCGKIQWSEFFRMFCFLVDCLGLNRCLTSEDKSVESHFLGYILFSLSFSRRNVLEFLACLK